MALLPSPSAIYTNPKAASTSIQLHAKDQGYDLTRFSNKASRIVFTCDRAGKYDSKGKDPATDRSKQRKATGSKKCGCLMRVEIRFSQISDTWMLEVLEGAPD